jgi:hypothetical protein
MQAGLTNAGGYPRCQDCHGSNPDSDPDWDPENPVLIRYCENCHSVGTLHSIKEHTESRNVYTVSNTLDSTVTGNEKCVGCHGDDLGTLPPVATEPPTIAFVEPFFGSPGITVDVMVSAQRKMAATSSCNRNLILLETPVCTIL